MVMIAYDLSTSGAQYGRDNTSSASIVVMQTRKKLFNVISNRNAAPFRAFTPHGFEKILIQKYSGWSDYRTIGVPSGDYFLHWSGTSKDYEAQLNFDPLSSARAAANTDSYNKCLDKLNDHIRGNIDLSVDALQGRQVFKLNAEVGRIIRFALSARRNPLRVAEAVQHLGWRGAISGTGSAWLAVQYGIKPLMASIYGLAEHSAHHYNNEFAFSKMRAISKFYGASGPNSGQQWPDYTYQNNWTGKGSARNEMGVIMRIPDSPLTSVARLTSLNPVSMAWELMPWSFVVDWFFNIGGYLRALETALAYSSYFVRGYRTTTYLTEYDLFAHRYHRVISGGTAEVYTGEWGIHMERRFKSRTVLNTYPMPSRPIFKTDLGSGRLMNAAGLLSQLLVPRVGKITRAGGGSDFQRAVRGFGG